MGSQLACSLHLTNTTTDTMGGLALGYSGVVLVVSLLAREVTASVGADTGDDEVLAGGGKVLIGEDEIKAEDLQALVLFLVAALISGVLLVFVVIQAYRLFRRHVLKIPDKPKSFVMDKKVKCKSGHNMMVFHVPQNMSEYIKCGSKSSCDKREAKAGF